MNLMKMTMKNIHLLKNKWGRTYMFYHRNYFTEVFLPTLKEVLTYKPFPSGWGEPERLLACIIDFHPSVKFCPTDCFNMDEILDEMKRGSDGITYDEREEIELFYDSIADPLNHKLHPYRKLISLVELVKENVLGKYRIPPRDYYKLVYGISEFTSRVDRKSTYPTSAKAKQALSRMRDETRTRATHKEYEVLKKTLLAELKLSPHQLDLSLIKYAEHLEE